MNGAQRIFVFFNLFFFFEKKTPKIALKRFIFEEKSKAAFF